MRTRRRFTASRDFIVWLAMKEQLNPLMTPTWSLFKQNFHLSFCFNYHLEVLYFKMILQKTREVYH